LSPTTSSRNVKTDRKAKHTKSDKDPKDTFRKTKEEPKDKPGIIVYTPNRH
jgi:hypothetical protein